MKRGMELHVGGLHVVPLLDVSAACYCGGAVCRRGEGGCIHTAGGLDIVT